MMGTNSKLPKIRGHVVFVGSKSSGKSSLYQCIKSSNPHITDNSNCSVLVEHWTPFSNDSPVLDECRKYFPDMDDNLDESVVVWDICGLESLWTVQQLCFPPKALFIIVFSVRKLHDAKNVPQWVQMIQAKCVGANILIAASNCEAFEGSFQNIFDDAKELETRQLRDINAELDELRTLSGNAWVSSRIEKLERIAKNRPKISPTIHVTSAVSGKGVPELRRAILSHVFNCPPVNKQLSEQDIKLFRKLRHDEKRIVLTTQKYQGILSELGVHDNEEVMTQRFTEKILLSRVKIAGLFEQPDNAIMIVDPSGFANACAMIHRDERPQDFVQKIQRSPLVERFWPTSTRPNDWTLRAAIEDIVNRGMIRESFFPLCWQTYDIDEDTVKQLISAMLKLGVIIEGAPKAGYEIELALSYFKNLSVTKRYYLPLLSKLPVELPGELWPSPTPSLTVSVNWCFEFQEGFCEKILLCILAASKNAQPSLSVLSFWRTGLIVKCGVVDVLLSIKSRAYHMTARCAVTCGNRQALNMAWSTLAKFINIAERYLSNFPGLYYRFGSHKTLNENVKSLHRVLCDHADNTEDSSQYLWLIPPIGHFSNDCRTALLPSNLQEWMQNLSDQSTVCLCYCESNTEEAEALGSSLGSAGFITYLRSSKISSTDCKHLLERCSLVVMLITKIFLEDLNYQKHIHVFEDLEKHIVGVKLEEDLISPFNNTVDVQSDRGKDNLFVFDQKQLETLFTVCRRHIFGTGDIEPPDTTDHVVLETSDLFTNSPTQTKEPVRETSQGKYVKFQTDHLSEDTDDSNHIRPYAACTVAAAMVGAAVEHLNQTRKSSSAGMRAANATAKVARAVAHGDADAATNAISDVVKIVDKVSNNLKNMDEDTPRRNKSKTCAII